jgi:hypothetical protein
VMDAHTDAAVARRTLDFWHEIIRATA